MNVSFLLFFLQNKEMTFAIFYETKWYEQDVSIQRLLIQLHAASIQCPLLLQGFLCYEASLVTFGALTKKCYSFLNLLRASFKGA